MNIPITPTMDELKALADQGYTLPRLANKFDRSIRYIRDRIEKDKDLSEKIKANGKVRSQAQKLFGCYRAGAT